MRKRARGRGVRKRTDKGNKGENRRGMENGGEDEKNERDDGEETGWWGVRKISSNKERGLYLLMCFNRTTHNKPSKK